MESELLLTFLVLVVLGSYVQTVSGFAIALILTGGITALGLAPIPFTANVVSFVALANVATALHKRYHDINLTLMAYSALGLLLFSGVGLVLLNYLSKNAVSLLEILLGISILIGGIMLMMHPHPIKRVSSNSLHLVVGSVGGLFSGLFSAGGPPIAIHFYRQPLPFSEVRATLLVLLGIMSIIRLGMEGASGHIGMDVLQLSAVSMPVSILATLAARRFPPPLSDLAMRRFAFGILCVMGLSLIIGGL